MSRDLALVGSVDAASDAFARNAAIDAVLGDLLGDVLPTFVIAVSDSGLIITPPPTVPVAEGRLIDIGSAMELCVPSEYQEMIDAWQSVCATGLGMALVHLRADPSVKVTLHFVDAHRRFGTYLLIFSSRLNSIAHDEGAQMSFRARLCVFERDRTGVVCAVDDAALKIFGWTRAELVGKNTLHLAHPDDRTGAVACWMECLSRPNCEQRGLFRYRHRDGHYIWFESTHSNQLDNPAVGTVISHMIDVSDRMEAIDVQRAQAQLLRRLTEALPIGLLQIDAQRRIVHRNERLGALLGIERAASIDEQFALLRQCDREALRAALDGLADNDAPPDLEVVLDHPSGERRCSIGIRSLTAEDGTVSGAIACVADITDRSRMRDELEQRAAFDMLTRCRNRATILETLGKMLDAAPAVFSGLAVLFIDLDGFKLINDNYGHAAGDELLRYVAGRLLHGVRPSDVVGRLGGDEFLIICPDINTPETALNVARRLSALLAQPTALGGETIEPHASIGVAWTGHPIETELLVARADAAMYQAKRRKSGPVLSEPVPNKFPDTIALSTRRVGHRS